MSLDLPIIDDESDESTLKEQMEPLHQLLVNNETEEVALILESLPLEDRFNTWQHIAREYRLDILLDMRSEPRRHLLDEMDIGELDILFAEIEAEDLIELADSLPDYMVDRAFSNMDQSQRDFYELAQSFDEEQIGHWSDHHVLISPHTMLVQQSKRLLRRELPDHSEVIYLLDRTGRFAGCIKLIDLALANDHQPISELIIEDYPTIIATAALREAADKVVHSGYSALPVLTDENKLLGRLDIENASDILQDEYEGQLMATAGLNEEEDLFSPVFISSRRRAVWLGFNLVTAFIAAWFIGLFQATLEQVVALAVLLPIVASMGGIAGTQTLTLMIRGLALGQISKANIVPLVKREFSVGIINGLVWAILIGLVSAFWFSNPMIGVVIGCAIIVNIAVAALSGVLIPVILDKLNIDPALSGSVILTTVTDIVGFVTFLGLGTFLLL